MKKRADIKSFIIDLENKFPVDTWTIDNIHVWPILRTQIFLHLLHKVETSYVTEKKKEKPEIVLSSNPLIRKIQTSPRYKLFKAKRTLHRLRKVDIIFGSSHVYRSVYNGKSYDKFADPILEEIPFSGYLIEHSEGHLFDKANIFKPSRVFYLFDAFDWVKKSEKRKTRIAAQKDIHLDNYQELLTYLKTTGLFNDYLPKISIESLDKLMNRFHDYQEMYELILNRTQPKLVFSICFYSFPVFALNYAANKRGIKTIEIQHGPQTSEHLSYTSWSNVPKEGFNTMPKIFWNWDIHSNQIINEWTAKHPFHENLIGGNPWIQFHRSEQENERNVILYSLQVLSFEHMFPDRVVNLIKKHPSFDWWIRMHPRQVEHLEEFNAFLKSRGIYDLVVLDHATQLPLPKVLDKTLLHITNFSGCALESAEFNIPSIILEDRGYIAFKELVDNQKAYYCPDEASLNASFDLLSRKQISSKNIEKYNYTEIIDHLIKE